MLILKDVTFILEAEFNILSIWCIGQVLIIKIKPDLVNKKTEAISEKLLISYDTFVVGNHSDLLTNYLVGILVVDVSTLV